MGGFEFGLGALIAAAAAFLIYRGLLALRTWLEFRGQRLVTCPETHRPAAVEVAAGDVAAAAFRRAPVLRLKECSRWPEREGCGQDCLSQVEADPAGCLVWNIVNDWYAGKRCAYCKKPFGHINWHDHRPALLDRNGRTVQWTAVPAERLLDVFQAHLPVCWDCHVAESFRREHPELVTDRPRH
jgi:hypothetical protein